MENFQLKISNLTSDLIKENSYDCYDLDLLSQFTHISNKNDFIPPFQILYETSFEVEAIYTKGDGYCGSYSISQNANFNSLPIISEFKELGTWLNSVQIASLVRKYYPFVSSIFYYDDKTIEYDYINSDKYFFFFKNSKGTHWENMIRLETKHSNKFFNFKNITAAVFLPKKQISISFFDFYKTIDSSTPYETVKSLFLNFDEVEQHSIDEVISSKSSLENLVNEIVVFDKKQESGIKKSDDVVHRIFIDDEEYTSKIKKDSIELKENFLQIAVPKVRFNKLTIIDFDGNSFDVLLTQKQRQIANMLKSNIINFKENIPLSVVTLDLVYLQEQSLIKYSKSLFQKLTSITEIEVKKHIVFLKRKMAEIDLEITNLNQNQDITSFVNKARSVKLTKEEAQKKYPIITPHFDTSADKIMARLANTKNIIEDSVRDEEFKILFSIEALKRKIMPSKKILDDERIQNITKFLEAQQSQSVDKTILIRKVAFATEFEKCSNIYNSITISYTEIIKTVETFVNSQNKFRIINSIFFPQQKMRDSYFISFFNLFYKSLPEDRSMRTFGSFFEVDFKEKKKLSVQEFLKKYYSFSFPDPNLELICDYFSFSLMQLEYFIFIIKSSKSTAAAQIYPSDFINLDKSYNKSRSFNLSIMKEVLRLKKLVNYDSIKDNLPQLNKIILQIDVDDNSIVIFTDFELCMIKNEKTTSISKLKFLDTLIIKMDSMKGNLLGSLANNVDTDLTDLILKTSISDLYNDSLTVKDIDDLKFQLMAFDNLMIDNTLSNISINKNYNFREQLIKDIELVNKNFESINKNNFQIEKLKKTQEVLIKDKINFWFRTKNDITVDNIMDRIKKFNIADDKLLINYEKLLDFIEGNFAILKSTEILIKVFSALCNLSTNRFTLLNQELPVLSVLESYNKDDIYNRLMKWFKIRHDFVGLSFLISLNFDVDFLDMNFNLVDLNLSRTPDYIKYNPKTKKLLIIEFAYYQSQNKGDQSKGFTISTSKYLPEIRYLWKNYSRDYIKEISYLPIVISKEWTRSSEKYIDVLKRNLSNLLSSFFEKSFTLEDSSTLIKTIKIMAALIDDVSKKMVYPGQCFNVLLNSCVLHRETPYLGSKGGKYAIEYNTSIVDYYIDKCNFNKIEKDHCSTFLHFILGKYLHDIDGNLLIECMETFILKYSNIDYENEEDIVVDLIEDYVYIHLLLTLLRKLSHNHIEKIRKQSLKLKRILASFKFDYNKFLEDNGISNESESGTYKVVTDYNSLISKINLSINILDTRNILSDSSHLRLNESTSELNLAIYRNTLIPYNRINSERKPGRFLTGEKLILVDFDVNEKLNSIENELKPLREFESQNSLIILDIVKKHIDLFENYVNDISLINLASTLFYLILSVGNCDIEIFPFRKLFTELKLKKDTSFNT